MKLAHWYRPQTAIRNQIEPFFFAGITTNEPTTPDPLTYTVAMMLSLLLLLMMSGDDAATDIIFLVIPCYLNKYNNYIKFDSPKAF